MSAKKFCHRLKNDVRTEIQRTLTKWRSESGIDNCEDIQLFRFVDDGRNVSKRLRLDW